MSTHTSPAKSEPALFDRVPLSDEQVRHFDEQGYLIVRDVLDADTIASLIEAVSQCRVHG